MQCESAETLSQRLANIITRLIDSGSLKPDERIPSERALAERAGISRMTARASLELMVDSGYLYRLPNKGTFVTSVRDGESANEALRSIGFFVSRSIFAYRDVVINRQSLFPNVPTPIYHDVLNYCERSARHHGYGFYVSLVSSDNRETIAEVRTGHIQGAIIAGGIDTWVLDELVDRSIPLVILDYRRLGYNCVLEDNALGAYEATRHLINLGHRQIACVTGDLTHPNAVERLHGYQSALLDHGLEPSKEQVIGGTWRVNTGAIFKEWWTSVRNKPTAVFVSNDSMCFGIMNALSEIGVSIPEDLSLVGFDDVEYLSDQGPTPLTSVRVPWRQMSVLACKRIIELIETRDNEVYQMTVPVKLIVRKSTLPYRHRW
jgi:DNA-binding LacI/PurR family transcriptional regulator